MTIRFPQPPAALVLALATTFVAACGGGGGDTGGNTGGDTGGVTAPPPPQVGSVNVALPAATVQVGASVTGTVEVHSTAGAALSGRAVTWTSSNPALATVTDAGVITGVAPGLVSITATSDGRSGSAALTVVPAPVNVVSLTLPAVTLVSARTMQAMVVLRDERNAALTGRRVTWASSNPAVAMVDATGLITGVASGTTTISASAEGKNATAELTVIPAPVNSVAVTLAQGTVTQGSSTNATVVLRDDLGVILSGRAVTWSSANPLVATVSAGGAVTAVGVGTTTITATSEGRSGSASITVLPVPVAVVQVTLAHASILTAGGTQAQAVTRDAAGTVLTGRAVQWTSSNPAVATVNDAGQVVGVAVGSTTITATSEGRMGQALLSVRSPVATVVFTGTKRVKVGDSYSYTVTARSADGAVLPVPVTWGVREPTRAQVTGAGVVTPLQAGSFTLVARIDNEDWVATYEAYDWESFSSSGNGFLFLDADVQVANRFGTLDYPELVMSCGPGAPFFLWVRTPHMITANEVIAYTLDGSVAVAQVWNELPPNYTSRWKPGSSIVVRTFAQQVAAARRFTFAFGEFNSVSRVAQFRVTGLNDRLPGLQGAFCPLAVTVESVTTTEPTPSIAELRATVEKALASRARRVTAGSNVDDARERALRGPSAPSPMLNSWPTWVVPPMTEARRVRR
jgi:uncharacterized protein YjdB